MDEIRYLKDFNRPNDEYKMGKNGILLPTQQRVNSKINIYNEQTGELIFEGHNKTVIAGSALTAMKLFDLDRNVLDRTPTYDEELDLDKGANGTTDEPTVLITNGNSTIAEIPDECQRKIIGFCVGQGGAGLDISDVFDVAYCSRIEPNINTIIPFRYPLRKDDVGVNGVNEDIYKGRSNLPNKIDPTIDRNAYYFKTFSNTPALVQNYVNTIGTATESVNKATVYSDSAPADKAQSYVELHLKITKEDCREFFIAHTGIENAKINQISLVSAWTKKVTLEDTKDNKEVEYFQDIRPFSVINIPNEIISNHEKSLSIVYSLYF